MKNIFDFHDKSCLQSARFIIIVSYLPAESNTKPEVRSMFQVLPGGGDIQNIFLRFKDRNLTLNMLEQDSCPWLTLVQTPMDPSSPATEKSVIEI